MMTDGRHIPLNRHLKKSDTFENHNQHELKLDYNAMKKLETFNDRTYEVNDEMRLQRVVTTDFVEGFPYHGDSSDDLVGNSRTNFVHPWGYDEGPSIEERALLFLEAQDRVKKKS
nr:putative reverse transcriptase domain-containing protein [Tanacetum cinerariifolium]